MEKTNTKRDLLEIMDDFSSKTTSTYGSIASKLLAASEPEDIGQASDLIRGCIDCYEKQIVFYLITNHHGDLYKFVSMVDAENTLELIQLFTQTDECITSKCLSALSYRMSGFASSEQWEHLLIDRLKTDFHAPSQGQLKLSDQLMLPGSFTGLVAVALVKELENSGHGVDGSERHHSPFKDTRFIFNYNQYLQCNATYARYMLSLLICQSFAPGLSVDPCTGDAMNKCFVDLMTKYFAIQFFKWYGGGDFRWTLVLFTTVMILDCVAINDIVFDENFLLHVQSLIGAKNRKKGWLSVEEQYKKAEYFAEERWASGDERCHWEMARDLIKELCDPIREQIRVQFTKDYRLEYKREQLKTNNDPIKRKEVEELDLELKGKCDRGTMSPSTLKRRLRKIAEKPEYDKYCPEGGRKKQK